MGMEEGETQPTSLMGEYTTGCVFRNKGRGCLERRETAGWVFFFKGGY